MLSQKSNRSLTLAAPIRAATVRERSLLSVCAFSFLRSSLRLSLRSLRLCVELTLALAFTLTAQQQQMPHPGYVSPAGGRQGTTFEITVGGQFLDGAKSALVSGAGVEA